MKTTTVLLLLSLCALALARSKPSGTVVPAQQSPQPTTKPTTTTTKSTTTTAKTTTASTTTLPPTTTQPPKVTNSTVGNYTLDNGKHRCLMAQMELRIRLASKEANGTFLLLPNMTRTAGDCNDNHATLKLISKELNITFSYLKNATAKMAFVDKLAFNLTYDFSKKSNAVQTYSVTNQSIQVFEAKLGKSYSCRKESLYMGQGLYLDINHDRMQAFNFTNSNEFGTTDPCPADQNNYRVAIAVGITLLVLIVVVVIAYLLARKKRTDGYQSL
ncbi:lysosome-associated membrane glycoprotein 1 isoform X3 [Boleophthalmus pectinirostris]|uniref:lysosome-associated membrane glycoprotein 1 isoform X2 n=1 Tax=Boleophthalmus pectinirostris TaxID=150288 RepID=UPI00242FFFC6|nr:lysosome-associated membrane glycoprotein 1 isoform X2 [Boleophthalmus pectinirostris]XP_055012082.1 lysosome-associated membrane glycoprotein 1 isoform X3 [Boleophthalmus pectinirostris]